MAKKKGDVSSHRPLPLFSLEALGALPSVALSSPKVKKIITVYLDLCKLLFGFLQKPHED